MNQRLGRIAIAGGLITITLFLPLLAPMPHRIDEEHFRLIKEGMTEADVEAIFGAAAGSYDWAVADYSMAYDTAVALIVSGASPNEVAMEDWVSRHGMFTVYFSREGRVTGTRSWDRVRLEPPWQHWWRKFTAK
jgi:hypothetical protein